MGKYRDVVEGLSKKVDESSLAVSLDSIEQGLKNKSLVASRIENTGESIRFYAEGQWWEIKRTRSR